MTPQLRILGVLALCASPAMLPQPPVASPAEAVEQATVSELLASTDPGRQAWGAMLAGNYGHKKFIPDLRRLLTSPDHEIKLQAVDSFDSSPRSGSFRRSSRPLANPARSSPDPVGKES